VKKTYRHDPGSPHHRRGAVEAIVNPPRLAELGLSPKSGITAIISVILEGALIPEGRTRL
jgi:hypothetical protein